MKKRRCLIGGLFVCLVFISMIGMVLAEKLEININEGNSERVIFKVNLYDDSNNLINGGKEISYMIEDYYTDVMSEASIGSGVDVLYELPNNPSQGPWRITARYGEIETNELFTVGKLEKASIRLEGENLIIENIGNTVYDRNILISIGESKQSEKIYLAVGGVKKMKLSAPVGDYDVKVDDGTIENKLVFNQVSLTGNVVGLEKVFEGNFFERYPIVSLFFIVLVVGVIFVFVLRMYHGTVVKDIKKTRIKKKRKKK
ncbi:hypothetical protein GOV12_06330 [Candidatus Pacearchaeota archaeon]|nr:hypothetical protein [Candidatus Pacearchaeota archaeon]